MRRLVTATVVGTLVFGTAILVMFALRPPPPPVAPSAPLGVGAVDVVGDRTWRWVGPTDCTPDTDIIQMQSRVGNGDWLGSRVPLVNVYGISFSENGEDGIAFGTSMSCVRSIALTSNAGRTWYVDDRNPVLVDAWWVGSRIWGIDNTSGDTMLGKYSMRIKPATLRLVAQPVPAAEGTCDAQDGTPTNVAFFDDEIGLLLCEQRITSDRLIARTVNAAESFERLTDSRPASGLDGSGEILDLDVAGESNAWTLFSADEECPEGQLRASDSQGQFWDRLPCLPRSANVQQILDVAFADPDQWIMLAISDNQPLMLVTKDGGDSWNPRD